MSLPKGKSAYDQVVHGVRISGRTFDEGISDDAELVEAVRERLTRDTATRTVAEIVGGVDATGFSADDIRAALPSGDSDYDDWEIGEALTAVFLSTHRQFTFPWPSSRDKRHPEAVHGGIDLVGFDDELPEKAQFAFGEVKTSGESRHPPSVVTKNDDGLTDQLLEIRSEEERRWTVILYLAHRAENSNWSQLFRAAAARYLENDSGYTLFGVLVRKNTKPSVSDLKGCGSTLGSSSPPVARIELVGLYFSAGDLSGVAESSDVPEGISS